MTSHGSAPPQAYLGGQQGERGGQREPYEWPGATVRTLGEVDPCDRLHPLHHTWWAAWEGLGGLPQQCPTATQGVCLVAVREEAIMPEAHEAAG
jgi:hypothetical protein